MLLDKLVLYHTDSTSAVHIWNNIQLNCSVPNTLTISYSDYAGLPGYRKTIDYRAVEQVKVECVSQVCCCLILMQSFIVKL